MRALKCWVGALKAIFCECQNGRTGYHLHYSKSIKDTLSAGLYTGFGICLTQVLLRYLVFRPPVCQSFDHSVSVIFFSQNINSHKA